jgi:hypothetical protein
MEKEIALQDKAGEVPEVLNVSSVEMDKITEELGFATIHENVAKQLTKLGVGVANLGRVKVNTGMLYLTHQAMLKCVAQLQKKLENCDDAHELERITKSLGYISEKIARSVKISNESEETPQQLVAEGKVRRASFPVGAVVQNNYHYYGTESDKAKIP